MKKQCSLFTVTTPTTHELHAAERGPRALKPPPPPPPLNPPLGAMAGKNKGAVSRIQEIHSHAIYIHCAAHALNLCVMKCCSIAEILNTMDTADSICCFFSNSPKRQLALERWIQQKQKGERRSKLKSICKTRWAERHDVFEVFVDFLEPLVCCFEDIKNSTDWNRESRSDAQSLLLALTHFPFIVAVVIAKNVLAYTKPLSVKLQGRYVDVVSSYNQISFVKTTLQYARDDIDTMHARLYESALESAAKVGVDESLPRVSRQQHHRANVPYSDPCEYYKRLTIPALDHLISEFDGRFHHDSASIVCQIMLLLPSTIAESEEVLTSTVIYDLIQMYKDYLPAPGSIDTELHCWEVKWKENLDDAPSYCTPAKVLAKIDSDYFPNLEVLFEIASTLAVTSAECEQSISHLRYLKTYLHSTMTEECLNGLVLSYTHCDVFCDSDHVVKEFAQRNPRRMRMQ